MWIFTWVIDGSWSWRLSWMCVIGKRIKLAVANSFWEMPCLFWTIDLPVVIRTGLVITWPNLGSSIGQITCSLKYMKNCTSNIKKNEKKFIFNIILLFSFFIHFSLFFLRFFTFFFSFFLFILFFLFFFLYFPPYSISFSPNLPFFAFLYLSIALTFYHSNSFLIMCWQKGLNRV